MIYTLSSPITFRKAVTKFNFKYLQPSGLSRKQTQTKKYKGKLIGSITHCKKINK